MNQNTVCVDTNVQIMLPFGFGSLLLLWISEAQSYSANCNCHISNCESTIGIDVLGIAISQFYVEMTL